MFRIRTRPGAVLLTLALTQTSCVNSENPLVDPGACKLDDRLVGLWQRTSDNRVSYALIGRPPEGQIKACPAHLMVWYTARVSEKNEIDWAQAPLYFFAAKVGDDQYMQIIDYAGANENRDLTEWNQKIVRAYIFIKYRTADGQLMMCPMNGDAAEKAVKTGALRGKLNSDPKQSNVADITLTESTDGLRRYFEKDGGAALFPKQDEAIYRRAKPSN